MDKRGQLIQLEFHFLWVGALVGFIVFLVLIGLTQNGIIPFTLPGANFLCN